MEKKCNKCGERKPLEMFYLDRARMTHKGMCKACVAAYNASRVRKPSPRKMPRYAETLPAGRAGLVVRGTPAMVAERIADIAAERQVVVLKAGRSFRVVDARALVGIFDHGCDYGHVLSEIAA